jgi:hypothetical protein
MAVILSTFRPATSALQTNASTPCTKSGWRHETHLDQHSKFRSFNNAVGIAQPREEPPPLVARRERVYRAITKIEQIIRDDI